MNSKFLKVLVWLSSFYLLLPIIIFFLSFIRIPYGIVFTLLTIFFSYFCLDNCINIYHIQNQEIIDKIQNSFYWYISAFVIFSVWYFISGIGGLGLGHTTDVTTGERIIYDLVHNNWPLRLPIPNDSPASSMPQTKIYILVYYIAFYLPAGLIGKICSSFAVGCWVEIIWGYLGCCLTFCWFFWFIDFKAKTWEILACLGIFLFFRTTSFISSYICSFYSLFYFGDSTTLLYGSPQHIIATWLTVSLVYAAYRNELQIRSSFIGLACVILHSPFTLPGVFFLFLFCFFRRNVLTYKNLTLGFCMIIFCFLPCALYILSNSFSFPINLVFFNSSFTFYKYLCGVFILLGIPALIIWKGKDTLSSSEKKLCPIIFASLFLSISFNMGFCNDFPIRVSMATLFLLCILLSKIISLSNSKTLRLFILSFVLISASTYLRYVHINSSSLSLPPTKDINGFLYGEDITTYQTRIGNAESFFFKTLAK